MATRVNVNLAFTADTSAAKAQLQELQKTLNNLSSTRIKSPTQGLTQDIQKGISSAKQLEAALHKAVDPNTGKLNLTSFNRQIKAAGTDLDSLGQSMAKLGPDGALAFRDVTKAIMNAEVPLRKTNTAMDQLWTTMKNTMKWQISATVIQGFTEALGDAFQYSKDLNKSLTDIQIVTNKSTSSMEQFAVKANKAAKALSTTTNEYAKASLIYYQQGLDGKAVEERAATTIKLANATGESADTVSEWMTAIWNNFDDGSKKLEYYADVLASLGAATASSADEIAQGLEKFAAIADTVGLSYEYAASALATVTAETRQSADVVGTAFKTIFARMQDLELGNTLDDGTTLGQYSEALSKIGVNIKTAAGEIKSMDTVLNELGSKWQTLAADEKVAVAQSVAGIRQYSQMMALMDNWDQFEINVTTAEISEGALEAQQRIYEKSWEASSNRVKASLEGVYDSILNDDLFISLNDGLAQLLSGLEIFIDSLGGLGGLLPLLFVGFNKIFGQQMSASIRQFSANIKENSKVAQEDALKTKQWAAEKYAQYSKLGGISTATRNAEVLVNKGEMDIQKQILNISYKITEQEEEQIGAIQDKVRVLGEVFVKMQQINEEGLKTRVLGEQEYGEAVQEMLGATTLNTNEVANQARASQKRVESVGLATADLMGAKSANDALNLMNSDEINISQNIEQLTSSIPKASSAIEDFKTKLEGVDINSEEAKQALVEFKQKLEELNPVATVVNQEVNKLENNFKELDQKQQKALKNKLSSSLTKVGQGTYNEQIGSAGTIVAQKEFESGVKKGQEALNNFSTKPALDQYMHLAQGISQVTFGLTSLFSIYTTITDSVAEGNFTFSDFTTILMSLGMVLTSVSSTIKFFKDAETKGALITLFNAMAKAKLNKETKKSKELIEQETQEINEQNASKVTNIAIDQADKTSSKSTISKNTFKGKKIKLTLPEGSSAKSGAETVPATGGATTQEVQSLGQAFSGAIKPMLLYAAAIAIIVSVSAIAYNQITKKKQAAEDAAKAYKQMADEYAKAAEKTQELQQTISDYQEAVDKTEELVRGTQEYTQALIEANDKAMELINNYGLIAGQDYSIKDGKIEISEEGLEKAQDEQLKTQISLQNATLAAKMSADQKQMEYELDELAKETREAGPIVGNLAAGAAAGAGAGALIGGVPGAIIGGVVGGIAGGAITAIEGTSAEAELDAYDKLTEELKKNPDLFAKSSNGTYDNLENVLKDMPDYVAEGIRDNVEATKELVESNLNLITQSRLLTEQMALNYIQTNMENVKEEDKDALANAAANNVDEEIISELAAAVDEYRDSDDEDWAKIVNYGLYNGTYSFSDLGGGDFTLKDAEGNIVGEKNDESQTEYSRKFAEAVAVEMAADPEYLDKMKEATGVNIDGLKDIVESIEYEKLAARTSQRRVILSSSGIEEGKIEDIVAGFEKEETTSLNLAQMGVSGAEIEEFESYVKNNKAALENDITASGKSMYEVLSSSVKSYSDDLKALNDKINSTTNLDTVASEQVQKALSYLGFDSGAVDAYAESIKNALGLTDEYNELTEEMAEAHLKAKFGVESLNAVLKENLDALNNPGTYEYSNALAEIETTLENWSRVELDSSFLANEKNLELVKEAAKGSKSALGELQLAISDTILLNSNLTTSEISKMQNTLETLTNTEASYGQSLLKTNQETYNAIQSLLSAGKLQIEDARQLLLNAGYSVLEGAWDASTKTLNAAKIIYTGFGEDLYGDISPVEELRDKKDRLKLKDEVERYHEIKEKLEDIEHNLNRISKAKERAWGADKISLINQERKALEEEIKAQEKYLKEINKNLASDKSIIAGYGATFDVEGRINNYDELIAQEVARVNNAQAAWENGGSDEALEAAEEKYEDFKDALDQYEETLNLLQDEQQEIIDKQYELQDLALEKITYGVEYKVEIDDYDREIIEFLMDQLEDDAYKAAESLQYYGQQIESYGRTIETTYNGILEILSEVGASPGQISAFLAGDVSALEDLNLNADQIDELKTFGQDLMSAANDMAEAKEQMDNVLSDSWSAMSEDFDELRDNISNLTSTIENYRNIIDLVGKDKLGITGAEIDKINQQLIKNAAAQVQVAKSQRDVAQSTLTELYSALEKEEVGSATYELLKEQIATFENELAAAEATLQEALANQLEAIQAQWEDALNNIVEQLDEAMGGIYGSIENASQSFERQKDLSELYLQDYEKAYETSKLLRDIGKTLDTTDNLKVQRELAELSEEVAKFQATGAKMSQLDLEYLQKRYDLKLAEIALEEAQNAKSQVSLRRDASGNYGYVYTADQDKISEAQANYDEAAYNYQDWAYNYSTSNTEGYLSTYTEYLDALRNLSDLYEEDYETFVNKKAELDEYYISKLNYYLEEEQILTEYNMLMNQQYLFNLADSYSETFLGQMYPDTKTFEELETKSLNAINVATTETVSYFQSMQSQVNSALDEAGYDTEEFRNMLVGKDGESGYLGQIDDKVNTLASDSLDMEADFETAMSGIIDYLSANYNTFASQMDNYINKIRAFNDQFQEFLEWSEEQSSPTYTITFKDNENIEGDQYKDAAGKSVNTIKYTTGENGIGVTTPTVTGPSGYTITGWKDESGKIYTNLSSYQFSGDTTLTPIFTKNTSSGSGSGDGSGTTGSNLKSYSVTFYPVSDQGDTGGRYPVELDWGETRDNEGKDRTHAYTGSVTGGSTLQSLYTTNSDGYNSGAPREAVRLFSGLSYPFYGWLDLSTGKIINDSTPITSDLRLMPIFNHKDYLNKDGSLAFDYTKISLDTGGYTGEWGPEGRWALLHQKEIVLNAKDTENLLSTVEILRSIQDSQMKNMLREYTNSITRYASNIQSSNSQTKQDIYITAEFPDATDRNEIEAAFNNLINDASQYVNKL